MFAIAVTGFPNLMDNERRVGAYVQDAVQNGNWICPRDATGDLVSKPPLLIWIASLATLPIGRLTRFALYLPSALGALGTAWVILFVGRARFGTITGFLGASIYLLSPLVDNQVVTARYDGLFTFPVALGALAAYRAWTTGRGWIWFWLACAIATLVKGPLGIPLAAGGLLAALWERRSGERLPIRGSHWAGVALYLLICGGWFALAYAQMGTALTKKQIGVELVASAVHEGRHVPLGGFYMPTWSVLTIFLPWSIFMVMGFWRIWKQPSADIETRRFERFLFCWFFAGLVIFSIAAHQRGRLIYPLMPAGALVAGRELARRLGTWSFQRIARMVALVAVITLGASLLYHHVLLSRSSHVRETLALKAAADEIRRQVGAEFPLTHMDSPFAVQFYLNTIYPWVSPERAARLLRDDPAAFVLVRKMELLQKQLGPGGAPLHELFRFPAKGPAMAQLVSNHPRLEWAEQMATVVEPFYLKLNGIRDFHRRGDEFWLTTSPEGGNATFVNEDESAQHLQVHMISPNGQQSVQDKTLAPRESWEVSESR
jgi:hypothetical protein